MISATRCFALVLCFLVMSCWLIAQPINYNVKDAVMPAPNAAALGKYGDIPVSYYTGVPNIGLPIYTVQEGPLNLPVSLSYHASGVRVAELASSVGLGWSLNAGGAISRTILGLADEFPGRGYYHKGKDLSISPPTFLGLVNGDLDGEPDLFSFNVNGLSGKFYLDKNNAVQLVPKQDIKITYAYSGSISSFSTFTITNTDGTRYIFGTIPGTSIQAIEKTKSTGEVAPNASTWYLLRMESADGNYQINLTYTGEFYGYKSPATGKFQYNTCVAGSGPGGGGSNGYIWSAEQSDYPHDHYIRANVNGYRLSEINAGPTKVKFIANTIRTDTDPHWDQGGTMKRLDYIDIETGSATYCTRHELSYDYFQDNTVSSSRSESRRLKLIQVQERSCDNSIVKPPTKFTYSGPVVAGKQFLPYRQSKAIDHWGFYNGVSTNNSQILNIPTTTVDQGTFGAEITYSSTVNRETNETYALYGNLNKIEYPTGGHTQFTFESNTYNEIVPNPPTIKLAIKNNNDPYQQANCGEKTVNGSTNVTLTPGELTSAKFKLYLTAAYGTTCENIQDKVVKISAYRVSDNGLVGTYSFNLESGSTSANITKNLTVLANFQAGVAYKFVLYTRDGWGKFELLTQTFSTVSVKAGGLRVKEIISHDGIFAANNVKKTYEYKDKTTPILSSGRLNFRPQYGKYITGEVYVYDTPPWTYSGQVTSTIFDEQSFVPLSSFQGYHIGYQNVKEINEGNGYTVYDYAVPNTMVNHLDVYPLPPYQLILEEGEQTVVSVRNQAGTEVSKTQFVPFDLTYSYSPGIMIRLSQGFVCNSAIPSPPPNFSHSTAYFSTVYSIQTGAYRLLSKTETLNGVSSITTYGYDGGNRFLAPTSMSLTNSDTKVSKTTYTYPHDLAGNNTLRDILLARNLIATPIETKVEVGSLQVGGSKLEYSLFNRSTGLPTTAASNSDPYPYRFHNYEMTWTGSTVASGAGWALKGTIDSYHHSTSSLGKGYPKQYTAINWPAETYEWQNGQIKKRTYLNYVWNYTYVPNTRLLASITDIDGQVSNFTYDKLSRLKTTSARAGNVATTYDYHFTASTVAADKNYVKSTTTFTPVTGSSLTTKTGWQYFDGLGRLLQNVDQRHAPNGKDVVTAVAYDNRGRQTHAYNPFLTTQTTGAYVASIPVTTKFTLTAYEASPLGRVASVTPPDWYATTYAYGANTATDVLLNGSTSAKYAANLLQKVTVTDPMNNRSITYTDKKGRVILSQRADAGSTYASTYNLYDDKDRLTTVIPPDATLANTGLTFQYAYDKADNLTSKKVPDAAAVSIKYNTRDQATLTQDGNLAGQSKYLATLFDDYGRPTKTGFWTGTVPTTITPTTLSITTANELTKNFYDGYDGTTQLPLASNPQYRGKVRKSMAKALDGPGTWLYATNTYDIHGRLTNAVGNNYQYATSATAENNTFTYDWADNPLLQTRVHKPSSSVTRTLAYRNVYDAAARRIDHFLKIDAGSEQKLANYNYDFRDRLIERNLHFTEYGGYDLYLQSLDYTYNEQNWMTAINTPTLGGANVGIKVAPTLPVAPTPALGNINEEDPDPNDLFYLELKYDQLLSPIPGTLRKDGNISQVISRVRGRERQAYSATYDYLSRMLVASYYDITDANGISSDQKFKEEVIYKDARGNIQTLKRNGMYPSGAAFAVGQIDNLTYASIESSGASTKTNKLKSITDTAPAAGKPYGYSRTSGDYVYDANGNLTKDPNKGITTAMTYNHLNLPTVIPFTGGKSIAFVYDATGRKLRKTTGGGAGAENYVQDYADGIEYRGGVLEAIYHEEGRITPKSGGGWQYEYSIKDHLGNTRLTFADRDNDGVVEVTANAATNEILQEQHYTPFGLENNYSWMSGGASRSKYRFGGKEVQEDFGLRLLDYEARYYDPAIGRFTMVDALAQNRLDASPYNFVQNNPLLRIDPSGLTDFTINRKSGEVSQSGETNDEPDRVLKAKSNGEVKYKKNGEARVAFDDIEKGILRGGMNFKTDNNIFEVGGEGQPTQQGVEAFALKLSGYVGREIGGAYFSQGNNPNITHITIGNYRNNRSTENNSSGITAFNPFVSTVQEYTSSLRGFFHTHPSGAKIRDSDRLVPSGADRKTRDNSLRLNPSLKFYILTDPEYGRSYPRIIDYTKGYPARDRN